MISDDIDRHLERGARLVRLFAELGNFFPTSLFYILSGAGEVDVEWVKSKSMKSFG